MTTLWINTGVWPFLSWCTLTYITYAERRGWECTLCYFAGLGLFYFPSEVWGFLSFSKCFPFLNTVFACVFKLHGCFTKKKILFIFTALPKWECFKASSGQSNIGGFGVVLSINLTPFASPSLRSRYRSTKVLLKQTQLRSMTRKAIRLSL